MKKKIIPLISIALSILLTISCLSLSASASDIEPRVSTGTIPSDLTGYIVTVPAGWTATTGYGRFDITGCAGRDDILNIVDIEGFGVGVDKAWSDLADVCAFTTDISSPATSNTYTSFPSDSMILSVTGGDDTDNADLLNWFTSNGATFTLTNSDTNYPVLPGTYTFTSADLVASVNSEGPIEVSATLSYSNTDLSQTVTYIDVYAGEPARVTLNGIIANNNSGKWFDEYHEYVVCPIADSTITVNETVYSQALLDFLTLNTDYEEINAPEEPIENITLPAGVYIFDPVLQVPSNVGVYPIQFRSNGIAFYGMSLDTVLSYGDSGLAAFAPAYTYSSNTWANTSYRFILLESDQLVDRRLGDYILAESEFLTLEDYLFIYNQGYDSGYDKGYSDGKNLSDSNSFIGGFFGDFFGGIRDSLNSLVLYQSTDSPIPINVTVWGVLSTIVMLFIVLFVLKLIAGG